MSRPRRRAVVTNTTAYFPTVPGHESDVNKISERQRPPHLTRRANRVTRIARGLTQQRGRLRDGTGLRQPRAGFANEVGQAERTEHHCVDLGRRMRLNQQSLADPA